MTPCAGPTNVFLWIGQVTLDPLTFLIRPSDGKAAQSIKVGATVVCHPGWDGVCSHGHDMVLLKINTAFLPLPSWVRPVQPDLGDWSANGNVTIVGYGDKEEQIWGAVLGGPSRCLRQALVQVLPQDSDACNNVYAGGYGCSDEASEKGPATSKDQQFCAASLEFKDACAGDSGSPVLAAAKGRDPPYMQVGITSYGGGPIGGVSGPYRECGNPDWPGISARVSGMKLFICAHVDDLASYATSCAVQQQI